MLSWLAAPLTCLVLGLVLWVHRNRLGWLPEDVPTGGRKAHGEAIPMVGLLLGLSLAVLALLHAGPWTAGALLVATGVGHADDRRKAGGAGLGWRVKTTGLTIAAGLALTAIAPATPVAWLAGLALLFTVTNAINFLDNTDGVAVAVTVPGLLAVAPAADAASLPLLAAAVLLGFAPWNWPRARCYLGDSGAYAAGLLLASTALAGSPALACWTVWLPPLAVPLLDFAQVVTARIALGRAPWVGDRRHVSHVLQHAGVPRVLIAPLLGALAIAAATTLPRLG